MAPGAGFAPPHAMGGYMYYRTPMDAAAEKAAAQAQAQSRASALSCTESSPSIASRPSQGKASIRTRAVSADTARSDTVHAAKGSVASAAARSSAVRSATVDYTAEVHAALTTRLSAHSIASDGSSSVGGRPVAPRGRSIVPVHCGARRGSGDAERRSAPTVTSTQAHPDLAQADKWLQCDRCLQWRRVPESMPTSRLRKWQCSMNSWDPATSSCEAPEEADPDDALTVEEVQATLRQLEQEAQPPRLRLGPSRAWPAGRDEPGPARAPETAQDRTRRTQRILRLRRRLDRFATYSAHRAEFKRSLMQCVRYVLGWG